MVLKYLSVTTLSLLTNLLLFFPITIAYIPASDFEIYGLIKLKLILFEVFTSFPYLIIITNNKKLALLKDVDILLRTSAFFVALVFIYLTSESDLILYSGLIISLNLITTYGQDIFLQKSSLIGSHNSHNFHKIITIVVQTSIFLLLFFQELYSYMLFLPLASANFFTFIYRIFIVKSIYKFNFKRLSKNDFINYFQILSPNIIQFVQSYVERQMILIFGGVSFLGYYQYSLTFKNVFQKFSNSLKFSFLNTIKKFNNLYNYDRKVPLLIALFLIITLMIVSIIDFKIFTELLDEKNNEFSIKFIIFWGLFSFIQLLNFPFERKLADMNLVKFYTKTQNFYNLTNIISICVMFLITKNYFLIPVLYSINILVINFYRRKKVNDIS